MTPFKIGSIYKQHAGQLVRLEACENEGEAAAYILRADGRHLPNGRRRLSDGVNEVMQGVGAHGNGCDLVEGELNAQGEPIAPTFYCAAETIKVDPAENIYAANPGEMTFEELMADFLTVKPAAVINRLGMKFICNVPTSLSVSPADLHMVARDDKRAPLESQSAGRYDPFKGFTVTRDTATPDHAYSHPLTRVADAGAQVGPTHGSVWVLVR